MRGTSCERVQVLSHTFLVGIKVRFYTIVSGAGAWCIVRHARCAETLQGVLVQVGYSDTRGQLLAHNPNSCCQKTLHTWAALHLLG